MPINFWGSVMTEWLSKLFFSKVTATNAATVFFGIAAVLLVWPWLSEVAVKRAIPENYIFPLVVLAMLAISHLCVRFIVFVAQRCIQLADKLQERAKVQANHNNFEENIRIALPALDEDIIRLLSQLKDSETSVDLRDKGVAWLLQEKWISKAVRTSASNFVAKIHPSVKRLLGEYERAELREEISQTIDNIRDHQRSFLDTFWAETIPYGTAASNNLMPYQIYSAGHFLTQKGLLNLTKITSSEVIEEAFSLTEEAELALREKIYGAQPKRRVVRISLRFVKASGASGGGALGSSVRRI